MAEVGQESGKKPKFRVIEGGAKPQDVIEVRSIGDYKPYHPSRRRQPAADEAKIIRFPGKK